MKILDCLVLRLIREIRDLKRRLRKAIDEENHWCRMFYEYRVYGSNLKLYNENMAEISELKATVAEQAKAFERGHEVGYDSGFVAGKENRATDDL